MQEFSLTEVATRSFTPLLLFRERCRALLFCKMLRRPSFPLLGSFPPFRRRRFRLSFSLPISIVVHPRPSLSSVYNKQFYPFAPQFMFNFLVFAPHRPISTLYRGQGAIPIRSFSLVAPGAFPCGPMVPHVFSLFLILIFLLPFHSL